MNTAGQQLAAQQLLNFGYLSAADIAMWMDPQLIQGGALNRNPTSVQRAVNMAVSEVQSRLMNIYDLSQELSKQDTVQAAGTATVAAGAISATLITGQGTNYTSLPAVTLVNAAGDPGAGGVITPVISPSIVTELLLLRGGGRYTAPPLITITGGGGNGATATCTIDRCGIVNSITLTNSGTGYTSIPTITFTPTNNQGFGAAAVASVTYGKLTALTITTPGAAYAAAPTIVITGGQTVDDRNPKLVKIVSIYAMRNTMGIAASVSDHMKELFKMADMQLDDIRSGLDSLPIYSAVKQIRSNVELVQDRFRQLG